MARTRRRLAGDLLRPNFPEWDRAETRDLVEALDEIMSEMSESEQYDASIDDRGFGPVGSRTELPWDDAFREADITMQDNLDGEQSVSELIAGGNLPPEARGYTLVELRRLVARVAGDEGRVETIDGLGLHSPPPAGRPLMLRGPPTPNSIRAAVCDALHEVELLGINFDDSAADLALACETYTRIVKPSDPALWDEAVTPDPVLAPVIIEVYHEHSGRAGGEPPADPYASADVQEAWNSANAILEADGWDIGWDSKNAAVSYFAYHGETPWPGP